MFQSPGAIIFQLGPLTVRWYGVMIALGFLMATYFAQKLARKWTLNGEQIVNCTLIGFIGGIVGARLYFVSLNLTEFGMHPLDIFQTWKGGMSIHGGLIGGIAAAYIYCRKVKLPFLTCLDIGGACLPLAQAIGRWGNFFNSEAFGQPVGPDFPLKLYIPEDKRPPQYQTSDYFHPTFLYECVWDLLIFYLLYFFLADRLKKYPGVTFMCYLGFYSIGRLLIEPIRVDSLPAFGMPAPILASVVLLLGSIAGTIFLVIRYRRVKKAT